MPGKRPFGVADLQVVIISHGHEALLPTNLRSLPEALAGLEAEIVVVDNLGGRDVEKALDAYPGPVRLRHNDRPLGFAENVNEAAALSRSRYLLLLNPDTEFVSGHLSDAMEFLEARPSIGVLGCRLENMDGSLQQSFRRFPTVPFVMARGLGADRWSWRPRFYRAGLMEGLVTDQPLDVDWVYGAFVLIRRAHFDAVGGMDEKFRLYYEDVDLCYRLRQMGLRTVYHPGIALRHRHLRTSASQPLRAIWRWHLQSAVRWFWKHHHLLPRKGGGYVP